jgi:hypothetical protein
MHYNEVRSQVIERLVDLPFIDTIQIGSENLGMEVEERNGEAVLNGEVVSDSNWTDNFTDALESLGKDGILELWDMLTNTAHFMDDKDEVYEVAETPPGWKVVPGGE